MRRSYAGGKPVRKFGGDLRFGRFVERGHVVRRADEKIALEELADKTGSASRRSVTSPAAKNPYPLSTRG